MDSGQGNTHAHGHANTHNHSHMRGASETKDKTRIQRDGSGISTLSFFSGFNKRGLHHTKFSKNITDYDLVGDIGGVDDISFLYLAKHIPTGDFVALQFTDLTLSPDFEFIEEVIRSVRNTKLCKHPNILPFFYSFIENERLWSVTYPVKAGSCHSILKSHFQEGFGESAVASILKEVIKGVAYLHQNHMIHNDIRANNILIDQNGEVRVTGLRQMAHLSLHGEYVKSVFSLLGDNIEWAAPEVMAQNSNYDEKADIYSIGITAMELIYNKTPFDDWPPLKVLLCKLEYECPALKPDKSISTNCIRFLQACLSKVPAARPSAHELLEFPFIKQAKGAGYIESHVVRKVLGGSAASSPIGTTLDQANKSIHKSISGDEPLSEIVGQTTSTSATHRGISTSKSNLNQQSNAQKVEPGFIR